jgi:alpha-soluble NSF attachment protein
MMRYGNQDVTFSSTREVKFVNALFEATEAGDIEAYTRAVGEFDQITRLDNWKTAILLKIKRGLEQLATPAADSGWGGVM